MQFGPTEDLESYPRDIKRDARLAEEHGGDILFNPEPSEMYHEGFSSFVDMTVLTQELCGLSRPVHFRGVCTVVSKLFNIVKPDRAYFGKKDAQQLAVIRHMADDLNMDIEGWNKTLFEQTTVRDKNGNDKLYVLDADFNVETFRCTWVIHCNLGLYNQNFSESIFDIVRNKEWTVDKMMEMISVVAKDNGDQVWTPGEDIYGLMTTAHNAFGLVTSTGIRTVYSDENHNISTSVDQILSNNAISAIDKCAELCNMDGVYIGGYTTNQTAYLAGKTMFMGELMCFVDRISNEATVDLNTTIIPEPLYSSETQDKYTTYVNNKGSTFVVSKNACGGDSKMTADFLNILVYHSHKIVYPAFLTFTGQICCNDENTPEMIDIIVNGLNYDLCYYKGNVMGQLAEMMHTGKNQLNRAANSFVKTLQGQIDLLVDDMTASE